MQWFCCQFPFINNLDPRCGGAVYANEEIIEKGISFHKKCFTCYQCTRPLNDKLQVFIGFDKEVYCKVCYPKIMHTPLPMDPKGQIISKGFLVSLISSKKERRNLTLLL